MLMSKEQFDVAKKALDKSIERFKKKIKED